MTGVPAPAGRETPARFLVGDVFDRLAQLEDGTVDLVVTSPPFLALRSYLPAGHPDKAKEIGSEPTPAAFLDTLLALTAEWGRVLAPHGSIAVELGDTYAGSGGAGGDYNADGLRGGQQRFNGAAATARAHATKERTRNPGAGWPLEKSLCGIPTLFAWSLAYGRNLLTGEPSPAGQWRIRNLVAWVRPNPPVGALGDKFRPATSYIVIATRARDRWFDLDAVRQPRARDYSTETRSGDRERDRQGRGRKGTVGLIADGAGAPPLDWWEVTTDGYQGAHYAVMPRELPRRLIEAMCPRRVCTTCGQPSRRIVDTSRRADKDDAQRRKHANGERPHAGRQDRAPEVGWEIDRTTTGWSLCGCSGADGHRLDGYHTGPAWRPGHVLDPFAGSGTTLAAATGLSRSATGIDLDERNAWLARDRVGLFLDIDTQETTDA